jgi:hypothetical protein
MGYEEESRWRIRLENGHTTVQQSNVIQFREGQKSRRRG